SSCKREGFRLGGPRYRGGFLGAYAPVDDGHTAKNPAELEITVTPDKPRFSTHDGADELIREIAAVDLIQYGVGPVDDGPISSPHPADAVIPGREAKARERIIGGVL